MASVPQLPSPTWSLSLLRGVHAEDSRALLPTAASLAQPAHHIHRPGLGPADPRQMRQHVPGLLLGTQERRDWSKPHMDPEEFSPTTPAEVRAPVRRLPRVTAGGPAPSGVGGLHAADHTLEVLLLPPRQGTAWEGPAGWLGTVLTGGCLSCLALSRPGHPGWGFEV